MVQSRTSNLSRESPGLAYVLRSRTTAEFVIHGKTDFRRFGSRHGGWNGWTNKYVNDFTIHTNMLISVLPVCVCVTYSKCHVGIKLTAFGLHLAPGVGTSFCLDEFFVAPKPCETDCVIYFPKNTNAGGQPRYGFQLAIVRADDLFSVCHDLA